MHFVVPALILLLLFLSFKTRPILRAKLALSATVTMLVLFLAETSLPKRDWSIGRARLEAALERGLPYDTRSRREVILALRAQGKRVVPVVSPATFTYRSSRLGVKEPFVTVDGRQVVPMAGVSDVLTIYCNEGGQFLVYRSDEHGFNNPKGLYRPDQVDIAAVGDSYTHGACVASDDNAMAVIRNAVPRSINFAMSGNGPLFILATLREFVEPLRPRFVLWFHAEENDLRNVPTEMSYPLLRRYLEEDYSADLLLRQDAVDEELSRVIESELLKATSNAAGDARGRQSADGSSSSKLQLFKRILKLYNIRSKLLGNEAPSLDLATFSEILDTARRRVEAYGGRLFFVYLPQYSRYASRLFPTEIRTTVKKLVRDLKIPVIDVSEAFDRHPEPLSLFPFGLFGHYSEAGHELVGRTVLNRITAEGIEKP